MTPKHPVGQPGNRGKNIKVGGKCHSPACCGGGGLSVRYVGCQGEKCASTKTITKACLRGGNASGTSEPTLASRETIGRARGKHLVRGSHQGYRIPSWQRGNLWAEKASYFKSCVKEKTKRMPSPPDVGEKKRCPRRGGAGTHTL